MISGLFIVGLGFSLQQIVANPLAIEVGPKETGSQRLTMAGESTILERQSDRLLLHLLFSVPLLLPIRKQALKV